MLDEGRMRLAGTQTDVHEPQYNDVFSSPVKSPPTVVHRAVANTNVVHTSAGNSKAARSAVVPPNVGHHTTPHHHNVIRQALLQNASTTPPQSPPPAWNSPTTRKLYVVLKGREVGVFDSWRVCYVCQHESAIVYADPCNAGTRSTVWSLGSLVLDTIASNLFLTDIESLRIRVRSMHMRLQLMSTNQLLLRL